ncbi:aminopeptidase P N-terminal domain-containing protein [Novosphingobium sp.]|uniref:aminopeptidase P N-terminal domain-containing protein n=1 Tax=Novosphingobium sp. TaxID=1874826 RepID=UPI003BA99521
MLSRRSLLASVAATALLPRGLAAQVLPPEGFGTPAGTFPFAPEVFRERRRKLMDAIGGGIAVVYGAERPAFDGPLSPPFTQDGDFAWLTGIVDEPGAILILAPAERTVREYLLLPPREPESERWEVERLPLGAYIQRRTGFAKVYRTSALGSIVTSLAERSKTLHFLGPIASTTAPVPKALELYGQIAARVPGTSIDDSSQILPAMRCVKEPREIEQMRKAAVATARGHIAAMKQVRPGWTEGQLQDVVEAAFREGGGTGLAYGSIVGTGRNAASLHYSGRTGVIAPGDLILIDAAASVGGYACDVTRTFPASGKFTPKQRDDYALVLAAHEAALAKLKAGAYYEDLSEAAKDVFRKAGRIDDFTHGLSHFVGLDVHDAGDLSKPLPTGAVITIEPGLYVQAANYGIRIEDIYLVTSAGAERLSAGVPRTIAEIEAAMAR